MLSILRLNNPNITNFAKERNNLIKKSKTDWNLFLDTDEQINDEELKVNNCYDSYKLTRKNYFLKQFVGTDKIIRLVKKGTGKFVRRVHEVWQPDDKGKIGIKKEVIIHNTADNLSDYLNKINKYSTLHAKENLIEEKKSNLIKIILYPMGKFFVILFKSKNIVFSIMQSLHSFLSWTKLYFSQH